MTRQLIIILSLLAFFAVPTQAADHFSTIKSAAEKGDATAQAELASIYFRGHDGFPDEKAAAKWWQKSANQGNASAQYNLSSLYFNGYGVEQDYKEAYFWLLLFSSRLKSPPPKLGDTLAEIKIKLSPEQLTAVKKRVAAWKLVVAGETKKDVWKDWWTELRRQCPKNHLEWIPDGSYLDLLEDFDKTLSPSLQQQTSAVEDYDRRCSMEMIGFECEMSVSLDAFIRLGLLKRFTAFGCHQYKCKEPSLCTPP